MSISDLIELDDLKRKWRNFINVKDCFDNNINNVNISIIELENCSNYLKEASEEERLVVDTYKNKYKVIIGENMMKGEEI